MERTTYRSVEIKRTLRMKGTGFVSLVVTARYVAILLGRFTYKLMAVVCLLSYALISSKL
jgi:hypothetical protein